MDFYKGIAAILIIYILFLSGRNLRTGLEESEYDETLRQ